MSNVLELLKSLVNPLHTTIGAMLGALATHLGTKYRNRITTLRWTARIQSLALSGHHDLIGTVTVLRNGQPVDNLYMLFIEIHNDSNKDLVDLEVHLGFRDTTTFLGDSASIRGSLRTLSWKADFSSAVDRFLALPKEERTDSAWLQLASNRIYHIPALNRGERVDLLVMARTAERGGPTLKVSGTNPGVQFRELPARPLVFGEPQAAAGLIGFGAGVVGLVVAVGALGWPTWPVVATFMLGALGTVVGVGILKVFRAITKVLG